MKTIYSHFILSLLPLGLVLWPQLTSAEVVLNENFEDTPAGGLPPKWTAVASGGAKLAVVEKESPSGKKCLLFQNATDAARGFEPDLELPANLKGTVKISFDVFCEDGNVSFNLVPRQDPVTSQGEAAVKGPHLVIGMGGKINALSSNAWKPCGAVVERKWMHVEIVARLAGTEPPGWEVTITREGDKESYQDLAYPKADEIPPVLTRLVFHGSNRSSSAFYLDNLVVEASEGKLAAAGHEKKKDSPARRVTGSADNLCLKEGVTVAADSYVVPHGAGPEKVRDVVDGDPSTYWLSGRRKTSLTVTFPKPVTVSQSYWLHANSPAGAIDERGLKDYDIRTSLDGQTWQDAVSVRGYKGGRKHDTFPPREARYVRLEIGQTQGFLMPVICEWELFEKPRAIPADEQASAETPVAAPPPKTSGLVVTVASEKMAHQPGETVRLNVELKNQQDQDVPLKVAVAIRHGVDEPRQLKQKAVTLKAGASRTLEYALKNVRAEYGHHVLVTVEDSAGKLTTADCVFEVADNWAKIARLNIDTGHEKLDPDFPEEEITKVHLPLWRKSYVNAVELFGQHVFFGQHYTDQEEWLFPYPNLHNSPVSAKTTLRWAAAMKRKGIHLIGYTETGSLSPQLEIDKRHPEWMVYAPIRYPADKHLYSLPTFYHDPDAAWPKGKPIYGPDLHFYDVGDMRAMTEYLAADWAKAVARFGWEGAFFDSFPWNAEDSAWGSNQNGQPLNTESPDEIAARYLVRIKQEVRKATGQLFVPVANFGVFAVPWHEESPDLEKFRKERAVYRKTIAELGILFLEQHPLPHILTEKDTLGRPIYPQTIEDTVRALRLYREAYDVNVPVMLMPLQYIHRLSQTVVDANLLYASAYAGGVLVSMCRGTLPRSLLETDLSENPILETEANYNKFAARYGEYLFDLNNRWLPRGEVACDAPKNVWWQGMASYRKYADGRLNVYVHLINRPAVPLTWGRAVTVPKPVKDLRVTVKTPRGKRLTGVWAVSPNGSHDPWPLTTDEKDGALTVVAPELSYWTMLLCQYEPSKEP